MAIQQSFWGMDADGVVANSGSRLVYFLLCHFKTLSLVKIGFTNRPIQRRFSKLECGNPCFELLGTITVKDGKDDRELHERFKRWHYKKEWFSATPELLASITELIEQAKEPVITLRLASYRPGDDVFSTWGCPKCSHYLSAVWKIILFGQTLAHATCPRCDCRMRLVIEVCE